MKGSDRGRIRRLLAAALCMGLALAVMAQAKCSSATTGRDMDPLRTPRPSPVPTDGGPKGIDTIYWNSWVGRDGSTKTIGQSPEGELRLPQGADYVFSFDLSAYEYARTFAKSTASVKAGEGLVAEIQRTAVEELVAFVHPVIVGRGLRFAPGESGTRALKIALKPLREPPAGWDGQEARLTLLELLRRTTDSIQKDTLVAGQRDEIFQFILAGNGSLQICFEN